MKTLLDGVANWKDQKKKDEFRNFLKGRDSFGARLSSAYLEKRVAGKDGPNKISEVLAAHRADIEAMPDPARTELAAFIEKVFPKGVPNHVKSPDAIAVFDLFGAEKAKTVAEEADEFLKVNSL